jgi:hypothetical protein
MAVHDQISAARDCGHVTCGPSAATDLEGVARAFGLSTQPGTYSEIDRAAAEARMIDLLQYDLAYDAEIMPHATAENLARDFLDSVPGARFYSNGTRQQSMPATRATFDGGVIAVGDSGSACFWVEDED